MDARTIALIDTNILVYRYDDRFPEKQEIATGILRRGIGDGSVRLPHQAIVQFVAAVTRPIRGHVILERADALREAVRGCAAYQLNWFDAHLWAYAEHYGIPELLTEDFQHDRFYGSVHAVNPFAPVQ